MPLQVVPKDLAAHEGSAYHFYQRSVHIHKPFTLPLISTDWNSGTGQTGPSSPAPVLTGVHLGGD